VTDRPWLSRASALVLAVCLLAGCSARAATGRDADTLVDLTRADGATMNPMYAETVQDGSIYSQLLFDGLSYVGADYLPHPRLATSWSYTPDGLHWTVHLRHGVRWSDGVPFTADDVVFSYRIMRDPATAFVDFGNVKFITRVVAEAPDRVRFDLASPSATFTLYALGESLLPAHVLGRIPADRQRFSSFGEHPVGTGPYMLARWQHDSEVLFVRNPYAWRRPKIAKFDVRIIFNDQAEMDALADGSADLIDDLSLTQYQQLQRIAPSVILQTYPSLYVDVVEVNTRRPGLSDVAVRQAMMYGYDRLALINGMYEGKVEFPDSLIASALTYWHYGDVQKYPYDPAKARAILEAAGWKAGPDGIRRKGNVRLSFELLLNQGSALLTDEMVAFAADMASIGIDMRVRLLDFASEVARTFAGNYDVIASGRGGNTDPDLTTILDSSQMPPNGSNTTYYSNPIVDHDLRAGLRTIDPAKRRVFYNQMQVELARTLPILFQRGRFSSSGHAARLQMDPKTTLQSPLMFYNVEDWSMSR
jgi:peptide/nickel transport system substrate-binding protein